MENCIITWRKLSNLLACQMPVAGHHPSGGSFQGECVDHWDQISPRHNQQHKQCGPNWDLFHILQPIRKWKPSAKSHWFLGTMMEVIKETNLRQRRCGYCPCNSSCRSLGLCPHHIHLSWQKQGYRNIKTYQLKKTFCWTWRSFYPTWHGLWLYLYILFLQKACLLCQKTLLNSKSISNAVPKLMFFNCLWHQ